MDNWFNSLSSKKAGSCCSNFDGRPPEAIVRTSDNHYRVMLEGQWIEVPDDAVLDVPNKYGKAVVWYTKSWRSKVTGEAGDSISAASCRVGFTEALESAECTTGSSKRLSLRSSISGNE
jgi:hypothetical protein